MLLYTEDLFVYRKLLPVFWIMALSWSCCLLSDPDLNILWLYRNSLRFACLSQQDRNNELLSSMTWNRHSGAFHDQTLNGWPTCGDCFRNLHGVSRSTWTRRQAEAKEEKSNWEHGHTGSGRNYTDKGFLTRAWMSTFFGSLGDFQPDKGEVHLPPMDEKVNDCVYIMMDTHVNCFRMCTENVRLT